MKLRHQAIAFVSATPTEKKEEALKEEDIVVALQEEEDEEKQEEDDCVQLKGRSSRLPRLCASLLPCYGGNMRRGRKRSARCGIDRMMDYTGTVRRQPIWSDKGDE